MDILGLDINHIIDLGTQVATTGTMRAVELTGDDIFDYVIGIAILIYEMHPGG